MNSSALWEHYKKHLCVNPSISLMLDVSRMNFAADFFVRMEPEIQKAFLAMDALESGRIANPDENRMVGHYWLRSPGLAPSAEIRQEIEMALQSIKEFSAAIHAGKRAPERRSRFTRLLTIGIGGSALGPQFIADALGGSGDRLKPLFLDNTDPDGIEKKLGELGDHLAETLCLVISKSGGTAETRNGMLEVAAAYKHAGLSFEKHAVAITGVGSKLSELAKKDEWIAEFPMWDWVGGRTSVMSAVGLLPAALQGINTEELLQGAALCDVVTRNKQTNSNPAALLALAWYHATNGHGSKDMVILPYKDRLQLFSRYLQQLIMESLGKEKDVTNKIVNQGITVYGNKGTTDQHAYVQQLRDGVNNFFATFIEVLRDRETGTLEVDPGVTSGDYLSSFLLGTRAALFEKNRESITITIENLDPRSVGALIALYERAVGFYASLVNINAYHQPGVEAGKKMAGAIITLQHAVIGFLKKNPSASFSVEELAGAINAADQAELIFKILEHARANQDHRMKRIEATPLFASRYQAF